ncbi:MAG TPA: two-component regulator propeller domain-containing protein, partial [Flavobacteriales bacterium]|nr:two-component regulator propeller domain-containing protein [Flavobacteriales bacterium]
MRLLKYVSLYTLCLIPFGGFCQQYNFRHFTTKNGLANPFVNHIFCDSRGFMWMSTQGGLSKFDGSSFINYTSREGLPSSDVLCSAEDSEGNLWIGTNGAGVARFNGSTFTTYDSTNGFINGSVFSIFSDSKNRLWFATSKGIFSFSKGRFTNYATTKGLPQTEYFSVCEDLRGTIWFGSKDYGPVSYNGQTCVVVPENSPIYKKSVFTLYCAQDGKIWCGTPGDGLFIQGENDFYHFDDERISAEFISSIRQDAHHNLWIATDNQLVKINGSKKQYFTVDNGLTSNTIFSLGFDKDG